MSGVKMDRRGKLGDAGNSDWDLAIGSSFWAVIILNMEQFWLIRFPST